jgi:hypothetical protein
MQVPQQPPCWAASGLPRAALCQVRVHEDAVMGINLDKPEWLPHCDRMTASCATASEPLVC